MATCPRTCQVVCPCASHNFWSGPTCTLSLPQTSAMIHDVHAGLPLVSTHSRRPRVWRARAGTCLDALHHRRPDTLQQAAVEALLLARVELLICKEEGKERKKERRGSKTARLSSRS